MIRRQYIRVSLLVITAALVVASQGCTFNIKATRGGLTLCVTWMKQTAVDNQGYDTEEINEEERAISEEELTEIIENINLEKLNAL